MAQSSHSHGGKKQGKKTKMHELVTDHEQCYEANKRKCDGKKPNRTMTGNGGGCLHEKVISILYFAFCSKNVIIITGPM